VPIFGPPASPLSYDIGTAFNLRNSGIQTINSNFNRRKTFSARPGLTAAAQGRAAVFAFQP